MVTQFDWYAANAGANALGLKEIHHVRAGASVSKFGYSYDLAGRIKTWSRQLDPAPANKRDWTMAYSRAGELAGVSEKNASNVETSRRSWSYDPAGNWYASGDSAATTHRTHNAMNRLSQIGGSGKTIVEGTLNEAASVSVSGKPAQVTSVPGTSDFNFRKEIPVAQGNNTFQIIATDRKGNPRTQNYSVNVGAAQKTYDYDLNGNLLREKSPTGSIIRSFEWDGADRLKAINSGTQRIAWTYNGNGQRVLETLNGTASKRFLWDGIALLLEKTPTHTITKKYYGDGEQRIGGSDAGNYFYTRDHLGSIREVIKQDGTLQARYDYDAYGKRSIIYQNAAYLGGSTFGYTGHITLPALVTGQSELVLTHFRAYDQELGRWLSADPLGEAGGMNLYGYVGNNPISFVDPMGLSYWDLSFSGYLPSGLIPAGFGGTFGFFMDDCGDVRFYIGPGVGSASPGVSLMHSNANPSPGKWSGQVTGGFIGGGAYGFDEDGGDFVEVGLTTPGLSASAYYTYNTWFNAKKLLGITGSSAKNPCD